MLMPKDYAQSYSLGENISINVYPWELKLPLTFFQNVMTKLTQDVEYVKAYLDDLLILANKSFNNHLIKLEMVRARLSTAGMRINAPKSKFFAEQIHGLLDYQNRNPTSPK
jgi:Reverse transcriptase (RNA-dependent DNA polymerase)